MFVSVIDVCPGEATLSVNKLGVKGGCSILTDSESMRGKNGFCVAVVADAVGVTAEADLGVSPPEADAIKAFTRF